MSRPSNVQRRGARQAVQAPSRAEPSNQQQREIVATLQAGLTSPVTYISSDDLKATLDLSGETFADADITAAISAASRQIDNLCRRRFYPDADANQIRYYNPDSRRLVRTDDLVTLTGFAIDNLGDGTFATVLTVNTDFILEPLNAPSDGWPYTRIRVMNGQWLPCQPRSIRVTGKFGWATAPDEIVEATSLLSSRLLRRAREAPFGIIGFAMDSGTQAATRLARQDPDVLALVGPYIRQFVR